MKTNLLSLKKVCKSIMHTYRKPYSLYILCRIFLAHFNKLLTRSSWLKATYPDIFYCFSPRHETTFPKAYKTNLLVRFLRFTHNLSWDLLQVLLSNEITYLKAYKLNLMIIQMKIPDVKIRSLSKFISRNLCVFFSNKLY